MTIVPDIYTMVSFRLEKQGNHIRCIGM